MKGKIRKIILGAVLCCASLASSKAQTSSIQNVGTSVANVLKMSVGARATAMGGSNVAECDDITSLYWNPGATARIKEHQVIIHRTNWIIDTEMYQFGAAYSLGDFGTIGLGLQYFTSGDILETTETQQDGTGRTFTAYNLALGLTYSRRITTRFSTGVTLKFIQEGLDRERGNAIAVDIGSVFETGFLNNLKIGLALSNLGSKMSFTGVGLSMQSQGQVSPRVVNSTLNTGEWELPLLFRFGLAADVLKSTDYRFTLASEMMDSRDYEPRLSLGSEFGFKEMFFLRGGYRFNESETTFSLGAGIRYAIGKLSLSIDYAYQHFGVFSNVQHFTFIFGF